MSPNTYTIVTETLEELGLLPSNTTELHFAPVVLTDADWVKLSELNISQIFIKEEDSNLAKPLKSCIKSKTHESIKHVRFEEDLFNIYSPYVQECSWTINSRSSMERTKKFGTDKHKTQGIQKQRKKSYEAVIRNAIDIKFDSC